MKGKIIKIYKTYLFLIYSNELGQYKKFSINLLITECVSTKHHLEVIFICFV